MAHATETSYEAIILSKSIETGGEGTESRDDKNKRLMHG